MTRRSNTFAVVMMRGLMGLALVSQIGCGTSEDSGKAQSPPRPAESRSANSHEATNQRRSAGRNRKRVLHRERSRFFNIQVVEETEPGAAMRCLQFEGGDGSQSRQACIDPDRPQYILFALLRRAFAGLLLQPEPKRVMVIGLGGGTFPLVFAEAYPDAHIDVIELDPSVVEVAREFFFFSETPKLRVHTEDGRVFVKRALRQSQRYDYILLDAFNGDYIPEHLMTLEFLSESKRLLRPGGVFLANTFHGTALYPHESATYQKAFGWFLESRVFGNRVILTGKRAQPTREELLLHAIPLHHKLERFGVDMIQIAGEYAESQPGRFRNRILTDGFSPANILRSRPMRHPP